MENKDIEKLLKESADEVKIKNFSERWENVKGRIDSSQQVELNETTSETVLATSANTGVPHNTVRNKFIISVCAVFLLIVLSLAIVLPITIRHNDKPKFFNLLELTGVPASENKFYDNLEETDLKIVNLEKFEVDSYALLYTEDNKLVGGSFNISDEAEGIFATIVFYNTSVTSSFDIGTDYKTCNINGFNILHKAELTGDFYTINAKASGASISYELKCLAIAENIEGFFEKFFG